MTAPSQNLYTLPPLLELKNIEKTFSINGIRACDGVSLSLFPGETVALMGENGAGKSTLASILGEVITPDKGEILNRGSKPGLVHQKPQIMNELSLWEMIAVANVGVTGPFSLSGKRVKPRIEQLLKDLKCDFSLQTKMNQLVPNQYQQVELIENLILERELIIIDEPDFPHLESTLSYLKNRGKTLLIITHKVDDALLLADRVIIMKKGRIAFDSPGDKIDELDIVRHFSLPEKSDLEIKEKRVDKSSGEIFVIAGLPESGLWDEEEKLASYFKGSGYLPSLARIKAMEKSWTTLDNLMIHKRYEYPNTLGLIKKKLWNREGEDLINSSRIKAGTGDLMNHLSGGNQKKLLLLRELSRPEEKILLSEPSAALDLTNRNQLYEMLIEARKKGKKITLLTSDPEEALLLGDRIVPLCRGKRGIEKRGSDYSLETLNAAMRGIG